MDGAKIDVFVGVDRAKTDHYAQAITIEGDEVLATAVPNDETALEDLFDAAQQFGKRIAVVIDMTASAAQLLLTVAARRHSPVAYVTGLLISLRVLNGRDTIALPTPTV